MKDAEAGPRQRRKAEAPFDPLHPASMLRDVGEYACPWLIYFSKAQTSSLFLRDATMASPYALLLFAPELHVDAARERIYAGRDKWINLRAAPDVAAMVKEFHAALQTLFAYKFAAPHIDIASHPIYTAAIRLLTFNGA
ncbi:hypothetical protein EON66_09870 [archaeon]|nr:MAG: hypothetical protein EON66_09870 [archaeon]